MVDDVFSSEIEMEEDGQVPKIDTLLSKYTENDLIRLLKRFLTGYDIQFFTDDDGKIVDIKLERCKKLTVREFLALLKHINLERSHWATLNIKQDGRGPHPTMWDLYFSELEPLLAMYLPEHDNLDIYNDHLVEVLSYQLSHEIRAFLASLSENMKLGEMMTKSVHERYVKVEQGEREPSWRDRLLGRV